MKSEVENELSKIKKYSYFERLKYNYGRRWFSRIKLFGINFPKTPTNEQIYYDYIWRDIQQKNKNKK